VSNTNGHGKELRELERMQRLVTKAAQAEQRRRELIVELHRAGVPQVELADRLTRASESVGGAAVGIDAVQHCWARYRYKLARRQ
jgi:hypothetical protein